MSLASFSLILGIACYVFGFPMVLSDSKHLSFRKKFLRDENNLRLISIFSLSIAALTLRGQSIITPDGEGLVIFFAWLALIEGALMALVPGWYAHMKDRTGKALVKTEAGMTFWGFVFILCGAFFTYMGMVLA